MRERQIAAEFHILAPPKTPVFANETLFLDEPSYGVLHLRNDQTLAGFERPLGWLSRGGCFSRTYAVCENNRVVAYFCISAGSVERAAAPGKVRRNAPDTIPVSVIGRLAVSRDHAGKGLGADMLFDALRRIAIATVVAAFS